ncbi:DUF4040 domain-containing protein [bacterium]|nr:DUF4040 domain-containing protein [bacterium]
MIETYIQIAILSGMVLMGLLVFYLKDLVHAAIAFAAFSFLLSVEFYILQAPDVAIAEAGIGAGLTTAILIIAARSTNRREIDVS